MHHSETLGITDLLRAFVNYTGTHFRVLGAFALHTIQLQFTAIAVAT